MTALERYLRVAREREHLYNTRGSVPDDLEEIYIAELDKLWWSMTDVEHDAANKALIVEDA